MYDEESSDSDSESDEGKEIMMYLYDPTGNIPGPEFSGSSVKGLLKNHKEYPFFLTRVVNVNDKAKTKKMRFFVLLDMHSTDYAQGIWQPYRHHRPGMPYMLPDIPIEDPRFVQEVKMVKTARNERYKICDPEAFTERFMSPRSNISP